MEVLVQYSTAECYKSLWEIETVVCMRRQHPSSWQWWMWCSEINGDASWSPLENRLPSTGADRLGCRRVSLWSALNSFMKNNLGLLPYNCVLCVVLDWKCLKVFGEIAWIGYCSDYKNTNTDRQLEPIYFMISCRHVHTSAFIEIKCFPFL